MTKTRVTIIGAGPVGLSLAIGLARAGIHSMIIEKHPSTTNHPKARGLNIRTMEIFRLWGIESALQHYRLPSEAHRFIWLESLQGDEITRVSAKEHPASASPTRASIISQDWVEQELLTVAQQSSLIDCRFNSLLETVEQSADKVIARVKNKLTGEDYTIESDYLIGADGASSTVREQLGIGMQGEPCLGEFCNIYCEMDLTKYVHHRPSIGYIFTRADIMGTVLLSKDCGKKWLVGIRFDQNPALSKDSFTDDFCLNYIKTIINDDTINITLINKAFWTMAALVANTFRQQRILLAGDAAHCLPPTGGLGMNTGIQDAHNLGWKLAAVINGYASATLLDSYYQERAPIAAANIAWSTKNAMRFNTIFTALYEKDFATMTRALEEQNEHLNQLGLDIGFRYEQGAFIPDNNPPPAINTSSYHPSTYPGSRAPHYVLLRHGQAFSILDLFDTHFVLLCSDATATWLTAARQITTIPLHCYRIGATGDVQDPSGDWLSIYQINSAGAVLVRPDGHVAWRSVDGVEDAVSCLTQVLHRLLSNA